MLMLRVNSTKVLVGVTFFVWLIYITMALPFESFFALTSVLFIFVIRQVLGKNVAIVAGFLIVLCAVIGVRDNTYEIFTGTYQNPMWQILAVLVVVLGVYLNGGDDTDLLPPTQTESDATERQKLLALVNSMADGVVATDQNKNVTVYNGAALDVLNSNVSLEGQQLGKYLRLYDANKHKVDIFALAHKSRTSYVTRDLTLKYEDGEHINVYLSIAPVSVGYGQESTLGYIILLRDITKEKSLEEERDEFISVVSHELRTPITVAEGAISNAQFIAEKAETGTAVASSLEEAHKSTVFLADMINDLSMLSRAENGNLKFEAQSINIKSLLEQLKQDYSLQCQQKGLEILLGHVPEELHINSSPLYVKEILQNFITNSIKYTEEGSITLSASHKQDGLEVAISDTGIGISKSDQKKLFDKFFRSEDFRTRKNNGTGLGLYVTKKLANLIGAKISIESKLNVGSTFKIYIPNLSAHHHRKRLSR
jgi:PAS domain S-box-containing protein